MQIDLSKYPDPFPPHPMDSHIDRIPKIVCLCGSTKFKLEFQEAEIAFGLMGYIVLTVVGYNHADKMEYTEEQKKNLDILHKGKIDLADFVFVVNLGGYIGESTRSEINYAKHPMGPDKPVYYLVDPDKS